MVYQNKAEPDASCFRYPTGKALKRVLNGVDRVLAHHEVRPFGLAAWSIHVTLGHVST